MNTKISVNCIMKIMNVLFLVVLENFIFDGGMGFFGTSFLVLSVIFYLFLGGLYNSIAKTVSIRKNKGLNCNAKHIIKPALIYVLFVGFIMCMLSFLFADKITLKLWGISYSAPVIQLVCIALIINAVVDVICGYQNGNGNSVIVIITSILRAVLPFVFAFFCVPVIIRYGEKVAALQKNGVVISAYAALGVALVYVITMLFVLIVTIALHIRMNVFQDDRKMLRSIDSKRAVMGGIIVSSVRISVNQIFPLASLAAVAAAYLRLAYKCGMKPESTFVNAGIIFGKLLLPICFVFFIFSEYIAREKYKLHMDMRKDEHKTGAVRAQYMIKNSFFMLLPPTMILTFLSDPIVKVFYSGQYIISAKFVKTGAFILLFAGISYTLNSILKAIGKEIYVLFIQFISFILQMIFLIFMLSTTNGNSMNLIYSFYFFFGLQIILSSLMLYRYIRLNLMDILLKLGKYGASSIVMMVLFIILDKFIMMNVLLLLLSMFFGYLLYYLTLLALKGISKRDETSLKYTLNYYPVKFLKSRLRM